MLGRKGYFMDSGSGENAKKESEYIKVAVALVLVVLVVLGLVCYQDWEKEQYEGQVCLGMPREKAAMSKLCGSLALQRIRRFTLSLLYPEINRSWGTAMTEL